MKILESSRLSIPEAKKILEERMAKGDVNPSQRSVYDYLSKYSKISVENALEVISTLKKEFDFDDFTCIQIVNIMPETVEELRTLLPKDRYISGEEAKRILEILKEKAQ